MKNIFLIGIIGLLCFKKQLFSQKLVNKSGHLILPEKGDFGLGFNTSPLFDYTSSLFADTLMPFNMIWNDESQAIYAKYFINKYRAVRGGLRLGLNNTTVNNLVDNDEIGPGQAGIQIADILKTNRANLLLSGGVEFRRGKKRIQGIYGGELMFSINSSKKRYTYGNEFSINNINPTSTDFTDFTVNSQGIRVVSEKNKANIQFGLLGIIGLEYFIAPKISLSTEYRIGLMINKNGDYENTKQEFDTADSKVVDITEIIAGSSSFGIDTDNNGGAIRLMFHF